MVMDPVLWHGTQAAWHQAQADFVQCRKDLETALSEREKALSDFAYRGQPPCYQQTESWAENIEQHKSEGLATSKAVADCHEKVEACRRQGEVLTGKIAQLESELSRSSAIPFLPRQAYMPPLQPNFCGQPDLQFPGFNWPFLNYRPLHQTAGHQHPNLNQYPVRNGQPVPYLQPVMNQQPVPYATRYPATLPQWPNYSFSAFPRFGMGPMAGAMTAGALAGAGIIGASLLIGGCGMGVGSLALGVLGGGMFGYGLGGFLF